MAITDVVDPPTREIGYAVQDQLVPWANWARGVDLDDVPQLQWPESRSVYHRMRTDSQLDPLTRAVTYPIRRRTWSIDPNGASDEAVELIAADLNLPIRGSDERPQRPRRQRFSHDEHLRHALLALWYGVMFHEQVRDDRYDLATDGWRLRRLSPRMPKTIVDIRVESDGGLRSIVQEGRMAGPGRGGSILGKPMREIPVTQLVAYPWDKEGANWSGRSMFRAVYREWVLKDRLLRIDTMKHQRFGVGVPVANAPKGENVGPYSALAQSVRSGETSGVGMPEGGKLGIMGVTGSLPDTLASINYHDEAMARAFLAMFMMLGTTQTGSRALGHTFVDFFDMSLDAISGWYEEITNEHVIEDMIDWNFGVDENAPLLVSETPQGEPSTEELVRLIEAGAITLDAELESFLRAQRRLPPRPEELDQGGGQSYAYDLDYQILTIDERRAQLGYGPLPNGQGNRFPEKPVARVEAAWHQRRALLGLPAVEPSSPQVAAMVQAHVLQGPAGQFLAHTHESHSGTRTRSGVKVTRASSQTATAPAIGHRQPTAIEVQAATDFDAIQVAWQEATTSLVDEWAAVQAEQIDALVDAAVAAVDADDLAALAQLEAPVSGQELLADRLQEQLATAVDAAAAEAAAQGVTIPAIDLDDLAELIEARAEATATLMARGIAEAAVRQAINRYGLGLSSDELGAALREHLEGLSGSWLEDQLGGALTQAQNVGRRAVMDAAPVPTQIYASELLDQNTCVECVDVDGREYGSLREADADYPTGGYAECLGGPRCRGTLVAVYGEGSASDPDDPD